MGVKFCRMTLLLGPPDSGKTTLLLALAGRLASDLKVVLSSSFSNQLIGPNSHGITTEFYI